MDIATLVGILLGLGFTVGGIAMAAIAAGASAMVFVSGSSLSLYSGDDCFRVGGLSPFRSTETGGSHGCCFKGGGEKLGGLVDEAVELADVGEGCCGSGKR